MAPSNTFKRAIRFVFLRDGLPAHRSRVVREYVRAQRAGSRWGSSPGTRPSSIRWSMCGATGTLESVHGSWPSAVTVVALFVHPDVRGFPGTLCLQIWLAMICPVPASLMVYEHPSTKDTVRCALNQDYSIPSTASNRSYGTGSVTVRPSGTTDTQSPKGNVRNDVPVHDQGASILHHFDQYGTTAHRWV